MRATAVEARTGSGAAAVRAVPCGHAMPCSRPWQPRIRMGCPQAAKLKKKRLRSFNSFRSSDLKVMGLARFPCAMKLVKPHTPV